MPEDVKELTCYWCGKPAHRVMDDEAGAWAVCAECDKTPDEKILIDVQGGLVQEVFVTPSMHAQVYLIDWDNIKEGDVETSPWSEWTPQEVTVNELRQRLTEAEDELMDRRRCVHCDAILVDKTGKLIHPERQCPKLLEMERQEAWQRDDIQFPRLLAEINAMGLTESQKLLLARSMDLDPARIDEVLERAERKFETWKERIAPDGSGKDSDSG